MPTVLLIRHGRTAANAQGVLAGTSPGIDLDEEGRKQAERMAERLARVPLSGLVSSPLERTVQTSEAIARLQSEQANPLEISLDERVVECHYGDWTGRELKKLAKESLWKNVQAHPSSVTFPGGESMRTMQHRAVDAVRSWNREFGEKATYAIVSHGDVIKSIVADALGIHLDQFQRIAVDPGSMCIIEYTPLRPFVVRTNDTGSDVTFLQPRKRGKGRKGHKGSDAAVGGGGGR